jgi:capsular polysaccharide biosynthesis protein
MTTVPLSLPSIQLPYPLHNSRPDNDRRHRQRLASWENRVLPRRDVELVEDRHVWLVGRGLLVSSDGEAVPHTVGVHSPSEVEDACAAVAARATEIVRLAGPSLVLKGPGVTNYGHWLAEYLPRLSVLPNELRRRVNVVVPKTSAEMAAVIRDSLVLMGVDETRIVPVRASPVLLEHVVTVSGVSRTGEWLSPAVDSVRALAGSPSGRQPTAVFVDRPLALGRSLANHDEVEDFLRTQGFRVVFLDRLDLVGQIEVMASVQVLVGVMGATLTNMVFAPPGCRIVALTPELMVDKFYWQLASICGHEYVEFVTEMHGHGEQRRPWDQPARCAMSEFTDHLTLGW